MVIFSVLLLTQCTYVLYTLKHRGYQNKFKKNHLAGDMKHLLTSDNHFICGLLKTEGQLNLDRVPIAIAVFSQSNQKDLVEVCHFVRQNSYFGLNLPRGSYTLTVLADQNLDGFYVREESVASRDIVIDEGQYPNHVGHIDMQWGEMMGLGIDPKVRIPTVPIEAPQARSLFYPKGTVRALDDPIFSRNLSVMGTYAPAAFMEKAPMMFYALEEDRGHKIPVIFVHGIGGSPQEFEALVASLDRDRFKPWFFYYPSGADLDKLASLFYQIFLSGNVVPYLNELPIVVVAHSMGGLVVRSAVNHYQGNPKENKINVFVSIASPFGGHADAAKGIAKAPMVIPSWYDLSPEGVFIGQLFEKRLPPFVAHHLAFARLDAQAQDDGVVSLESQQRAEAMAQATSNRIFTQTHTSILEAPDLIQWVDSLISTQKPPWPEDHWQWMIKGGFQIDLPANYSDKEKFAIENYGRYMRAMAQKVIKPALAPQQEFLDVVSGKAPPTNFMESAWLKFKADFPGLAFGLNHDDQP